MWSDFSQKLKAFSPISLSELNVQSSFLDRIDVKYIIPEAKFEDILGDLEKNFYLLEIDGKSIFEYSSIYMDSEKYNFYYQHQNRENPRTKVRTRLYIESNIAFFEYKQKEENVTRKFRYQFDTSEHGKIGKEATKFFEGTYQSLYGKVPETIFPSLETKYNRLTFCSKKNDERLTVDFHIQLKDLRNEKTPKISLENVVIIESKSNSSKCLSHKIMKKHDVKIASSCSKYGLGCAYTWVIKDFSVFEDTMKKMDGIRAEK